MKRIAFGAILNIVFVSISRILYLAVWRATVIYLGQPLPTGSSGTPIVR